MALLTKKEEGDSLIKIIGELREQGLSDKEVVEDLREDGYKNQEILDGLKKADMKAASKTHIPNLEPAYKEEIEEEPQMDYPSPTETGMSSNDVEELAEKIVEEKWEKVSKELRDLQEWKDNATKAIEDVRSRVSDMASAMERIRISVSEKVAAYSKGLEDVGAEIQAMDKVFKKVLPEFTGNVKQLSEIVDKLKKK